MTAHAMDGAPPGDTASDRRMALIDRADLLYCLSRAFMPPPQGWSVRDWAEPLETDFSELGASLGIDVSVLRSALADACERSDACARQGVDADTWLVEYARLFLVPPVPVPLNSGVYLEGAIGGAAAQMMRSCYHAAGVVPNESFHDLPDHVSMQLEFVARLYERAARGQVEALTMAEEFSDGFIRAWAPSLEKACESAATRWPNARVYAALAALLTKGVRSCLLPRQAMSTLDR